MNNRIYEISEKMDYFKVDIKDLDALLTELVLTYNDVYEIATTLNEEENEEKKEEKFKTFKKLTLPGFLEAFQKQDLLNFLLEDYIDQELKKPIYEGKSADELFDMMEVKNGSVKETLYYKLLTNAYNTYKIDLEKADHERLTAENQSQIVIKSPDRVPLPLDNINSQLWKYTAEISTNVPMDKKDPECYVVLDTKTNEYKIGDITLYQYLDSYDFRVMRAALSLLLEGNEDFTTAEIYKYMGYKNKKPHGYDLEKIRFSMKKLFTTWIRIDGTQEAIRHGKDPKDAIILESTILKGIFVKGPVLINNKVVYEHWHIDKKDLPVPYLFAQMIGNQLTTYSIEEMKNPLRMDSFNIGLQDLIMNRIARNRKANKKQKIITFALTFDLLYTYCVDATTGDFEADQKNNTDLYVKSNPVPDKSEDIEKWKVDFENWKKARSTSLRRAVNNSKRNIFDKTNILLDDLMEKGTILKYQKNDKQKKYIITIKG